jgi:hypothetical protein
MFLIKGRRFLAGFDHVGQTRLRDRSVNVRSGKAIDSGSYRRSASTCFVSQAGRLR